MNEPDILYAAIFCFSMLVIGLLLTMWEFSRIKKAKKGNSASLKSDGAGANAPKLSGV